MFSRVEGGKIVVHRIQVKLGLGKLDDDKVIKQFKCMESTARAAFVESAVWGTDFADADAWQKLWLVTTREVRPDQRKALLAAGVGVVDASALRSSGVWPDVARRLGKPFK